MYPDPNVGPRNGKSLNISALHHVGIYRLHGYTPQASLTSTGTLLGLHPIDCPLIQSLQQSISRLPNAICSFGQHLLVRRITRDYAWLRFGENGVKNCSIDLEKYQCSVLRILLVLLV